MNYVELIQTLENTWKVIQKYNPEIPEVILVVASGGRSSATKLGHFAKDSWTDNEQPVHEVLVVAEQLHRGASDIFLTLLHEAAHGLAAVRGIKDVSGQRHNKRFLQLALELGLQHPKKSDLRLGFSYVELSEETTELYLDQIAQIEEALKVCRVLKLKEKDAKKTSWASECEDCGNKIRIGKKLLEGSSTILELDYYVLPVACTDCGTQFKLAVDDM